MDPKSPQGMKVLVEVRPLGHQDVPNPDGLLQQVRDGHQGQKPGIEEDDIPDPRPVYGAEALQRVDAAIGL